MEFSLAAFIVVIVCICIALISVCYSQYNIRKALRGLKELRKYNDVTTNKSFQNRKAEIKSILKDMQMVVEMADKENHTIH